MRLRNILIVVEDIEKSKKFYHDLFGLDVILDNEENVILTEGLVLQEKTIWKNFLERDIISESNSCELYFEEKNIEAFVEKLDKLYPDIKFVNRLMMHSWGQKIVRFYDRGWNTNVKKQFNSTSKKKETDRIRIFYLFANHPVGFFY